MAKIAADNTAIPAEGTLFGSCWGDKWCDTKCYKTVAMLEKKLLELGVTAKNRPLLVQIPTGKNAGKYTAIFPAEGGNQLRMAHLGYQILG